MSEYRVSKVIAKKKKYIFLILIAVFVMIAVATTVIGSFALYQFDTTKKNFVDNTFAKTIEITSYSPKSNESRKLNNMDIDRINDILKKKDKECKVVIEYLIHFGIPTDTGDVFFVKSFSDDFFTEAALDNPGALITKKEGVQEKLTLCVPIINSENGGYVSDTSITQEYDCVKIDNNSQLSSYFMEDELIASMEVFRSITEVMFSEEVYTGVESIYVYVDRIDDIKEVAYALNNEKYDVKHAFEYYDDLDVNVSRLLRFSLIVLILLLFFALFFLVGLFELTLKNSVGDIAILKHIGFSDKAIKRIYLYPMTERLAGSVLVIFAINIFLYRFQVINNFTDVLLFVAISGVLGGIALVVMLSRISFYCRKDVLALLREYKVEE